jgi:hypothetical protein
MDVLERVALMSDEDAVKTVQRFARQKLDTKKKSLVEDFSPDLRDELQKYLIDPDPTEAATSPPESVVARQALVLLAKDKPAKLKGILAAGEAEGVFAAIALVTAALVILQTEVKVKKERGRWKVDFHKRPASDGLLQSFLKSVCRLK